jgi:hypothetical protein
MKNMILVLAMAFALPAFSQDLSQDLSIEAKEMITEAIGEYVYFEDEGFERLPQSYADFKYELADENKIIVSGKSLSEWDMKEIEYNCEINVLSRGLIEKAEDIEVVSCTLEGEHWPHM